MTALIRRVKVTSGQGCSRLLTLFRSRATLSTLSHATQEQKDNKIVTRISLLLVVLFGVIGLGGNTARKKREQMNTLEIGSKVKAVGHGKKVFTIADKSSPINDGHWVIRAANGCLISIEPKKLIATN